MSDAERQGEAPEHEPASTQPERVSEEHEEATTTEEPRSRSRGTVKWFSVTKGENSLVKCLSTLQFWRWTRHQLLYESSMDPCASY